MDSTKKEKFIDVEKVIGSKNPKLLKWLPKFLLNYIKKVLHEDAVNQFIEDHGDKHDVAFANKIIEVFGADLKVTGQENIPKTGGVILASNHPLGGLDGVALIKTIGEVRYLHGTFGKGTWTFYGGHDPEDYQHMVGEEPTDLTLYPNSAGYRLILNNILFPAAKKKKQKT